MSHRTKPRIHQTAALFDGADVVPAMNAACHSMPLTITADERTSLQSVDHASFFAALDRPLAHTDRLQAAFARYRETITSR